MTNQHKTKLLIVDDLPENLQALEKVIETEDRLIFKATSGEAALELLLEHEFALAILDVMMPEMNGFELAELMRGTEKTRHIPIVFVSASGKELNYAFRGYETGAVDFLHKPLDISAVKSKVCVFVSLYQQRLQVKQQVEALEQSRQELRATQAQLERALTMRDEFMSLVAHELRNPLNTLYVESQMRQMLLDKGNISVFDAKKLQAMVTRDTRQIESMIRLINDMNDVSRIDNGKLSIVPIETNLSNLIQNIIADIAHQTDASGSSFILDVPADVIGVWDEFRIEQIITNLLTNALRYGDGKPVMVILSTDGITAELNIRDHGQGIEATQQERIFEKFERGNTKKAHEGLGMGLYIARQLAEAHKGSLTVESTVGEGSTFTLKLPLNVT